MTGFSTMTDLNQPAATPYGAEKSFWHPFDLQENCPSVLVSWYSNPANSAIEGDVQD